MKEFVKNILGWVLSGLVVWLVPAIVVIVIIYAFGYLENTGRDFLLLFSDQIPRGTGVLMWIFVFLITGLLVKQKPVKRFLSRIPMLGIFFGGESAMTIEKLTHLQPCLFPLSPTCLSFGWVLSEQEVRISGGQTLKTLLVYFPNIPTIITGQTYIVRKDESIRLGISSQEMTQMMMYGSRLPANLKFIPWEGENKAAFDERAQSIGKKTVTLPNEATAPR